MSARRVTLAVARAEVAHDLPTALKRLTASRSSAATTRAVERRVDLDDQRRPAPRWRRPAESPRSTRPRFDSSASALVR
ncbi:MAG: hypothetical protein AVDCRST_MAG40-2694 [uncultured Gemmatimonadaceae bacterium]|uniref:Uncharacterized protein n=1 Tax=uncultured Gemmatimonadaceae bacterium TaxID=246130 RepID=A0A6J4M2R1_9BACT|nr:MAG: hypothetical protein AVDCRST_MAG40-2694 [uncultured Gemmatimonadaceae bacterium]